jgi:predicted RNase H-like HicB family nuclease
MRQALVYPGEDGLWVAESPSLPGCFSQGESREQAITNIREAIEGCILALQDDGSKVLSFPGFHQLFFLGDCKRELLAFGQLYNIETRVV